MYSENSKKKTFYLLSDIIALILTYVTLSLFYDYIFLESSFFVAIFGLLIVGWGILSDEYASLAKRGYLKEARASFIYGVRVLILLSFVLMVGKIRFLDDIANISYFFLVQVVILSSAFVYVGRVLVKNLLKNQKSDFKNVILLTNFTSSNKTLEEVLTSNNYRVIAYVGESKQNKASVQPLLNDLSSVRDFIAHNQVDEIFIDSDISSQCAEMIRYFELSGIPTSINITRNSEYYIGTSVVKKISDLTFVTTAITIAKFRQLILKRLIDISIALAGLILTGIAALIIAPIVKKESPGPILFKQKRVGKNGRVFEMYKFRSMYVDAEERKKELLTQNDLDTNLMFKMENDPRIFPFGHKLRDWSIDELPQFINVLKGEMSVVGTRPPTLDEYQKYEMHHFKRLSIKPGITGLWQVSGRSGITDFEEVVSLDTQYIQNWNIGEDIKIIVKTFAVVLKREGSR